MNLKTGAVYLSLLFGASSFSCSSSVQMSVRSPGPIVEYHADKIEAGLRCDDVAKISIDDFSFYACEKDVNPELIKKLEYVAAVKKYGIEKMGMKKTKNYQVYKDGTDEVPVTLYRLYIVPKTEIPQVWVGCRIIEEDGEHQPVIEKADIFCSTEDNLLDEKKHYSKIGFDTYKRDITSFVSPSVSCNSNPDFLEQPKAEQANDILHEKFHVIVNQESSLEESFATLLGRVGAVGFTAEYFGEDSEEHQEAKKNLEWKLKYSKNIIETNAKLLKLYGENISLEEKLAKKEEILIESKYTHNNAQLWDRLPYTKNFHLVYEVYKKHPDLKELVRIFANCPPTEKEGIRYLKMFL